MIVKDFRVDTTDARFKAYPHFRFVIKPSSSRLTSSNIANLKRFVDQRKWCMSTWGPSMELDLWRLFWYANETKDLNVNWAYESAMGSNSQLALYFKSEEEFTLYQLRWS